MCHSCTKKEKKNEWLFWKVVLRGKKEKAPFPRVRSKSRELQEKCLCGEVGVGEKLTPYLGWSKTAKNTEVKKKEMKNHKPLQ